MRRAAAMTVFGCASVLLSYPEETFEEDLAAVRQAAMALPAGAVRSGLLRTTGYLADVGQRQAAKAYVDTFDLRRGTTLHLTYYRHGDTRERGTALARLVDAYRSVGLAPTPGELPDFLPALLELAAVDPEGTRALGDQRMAISALYDALVKAGSAYAPAVSAVSDALPAASRLDEVGLRRYRKEGPPSELVGLEAFAAPEVLGQGVAPR